MRIATVFATACMFGFVPVCNAIPFTTVTFDEAITPFSGAGQQFVTQGFQFVMGPDNTANIADGANWCSPECPENGSKYLLSLDSGRFEAVTMSRLDGGLFSLLAFDTAEAFEAPVGYSSATTINVLGTRFDGSTVSWAYSLDGINDGSGPAHDFQTFLAPFFGLTSLSFTGSGGPFAGQDGNFYQFFSLDNIRLVSVSEPGMLCLFATGLLASCFLRRGGRAAA